MQCHDHCWCGHVGGSGRRPSRVFTGAQGGPPAADGRGRYVSDHTLPALLQVAFVRSPLAHGWIRSIDTAAALAAPGVVAVVTGEDAFVAGVELRARSALPGYVETAQPVLARGKVRFAGEAIAAVVATDRYLAEDAAELVEIDLDPLPVVVDAPAAVDSGVTVHDEAPDNVLVRRTFSGGDIDAALAGADLIVERSFSTNRHGGVPLEGRGCVAQWDPAAGQLTVWLGTQMPHMARNTLAELLGVAEARVRVIAPDVGGGFGVKVNVYPEEVVLALLARQLGRPVKWVEDRTEHLLASTHARQHHYTVRAGFATDGELLALDATALCNAGAYSPVPWTAGIEPLMAGGLLPGPYKVAHYRCEVLGVATNTAATGAYRGVARPATVFVMERVLDIAASALGIDPVAIRHRNLVGPADIPYTAATRLIHDSGTYPECLERVVEALDYATVRVEQARRLAAGEPRIGVGFACYNELTGMGKAASAGPRITFRTGHEAATVRIDPSGSVTVLAGVSSQGQGLETTLAQVVATELGVSYDQVEVRFGDTAESLFGFGAFASRQGIIGGGAALVAARAVKDKVLTVAAHLLEAAPEDLAIAEGRIIARDAPSRGIELAEVARVAYLEAHRLPEGCEPGLDATRFYDPVRGTFAAGAQAAVVEIDPATCLPRILRYLCVEDAGRLVNPQIVHGQVAGSIAQGIGGALYEHHVYDELGNLRTATLADYLMPGATEIPDLELDHVLDPADNVLGIRGVGEGGTLGSAAVLANAIADALGIDICDLPLDPARLWETLR